MPEIIFNVISANVRHDMTHLQRMHDFRIATKRYPGIKFFQEIDPPSKPELKGVLHRNGFSVANLDCEVPIGMSKAWDIHRIEKHRLNRGRRRHNPARFLSVVLADKNSFHVAFCNMHMQQKPNASDYNHRLWADYFHKAQTLMKGYRDAGYTLVFGGDLNRSHVVSYFSAQLIIAHHGLDQLFVLPAKGVRATLLRTWRNPNMNSDHDLIGAKVHLFK